MTDTLKQYKNRFQEALLQNVIPFWMKHGWDRENGGVYSYLDRKGERCSSVKSVWIQGRFMWILSKLCNEYGARDEWLDAAKSCQKFLSDHCFAADGRMYFQVTGDGKPVRRRRYWFSEAFYCIGSAEYYKATGDTKALETARELYATTLSIYTDSANDPRKFPPKYEFTAAGLGPPMIMLNVTNIMRQCDPEKSSDYDAGAKKYISAVTDRFYKEDLKCLLENTDANGGFMRDTPMGRLISPGHSLEAAWFLLDEASCYGDEALTKKALNILDWSLELGWDKENGGIVYFTDLMGYPPEQYEHDMKLWWPQNEATIAVLKAYAATGETRYFDWFEKLTRYQFEFFADDEYGEWVGYLHKDNTRQLPMVKGNYFKGPFHIPRMLVVCDKVLDQLTK